MAKKSRKPRTSAKAGPEITSEAALAFIRRIQKAFPKVPRTNAEKARLEKYLARFTRARLQAVGERVQSDLMLRPPETIRPEDYPPAGRKVRK
jgi:hypothetical protein